MVEPSDASEHARALSAMGSSKGGRARAASLTKEQRIEIARQAAEKRWQTEGHDRPTVLKATHGTPDRPLRIGDIEIPCYVLEDGTRVVTQRGLQKGIGMSTSGGNSGAHRTAQFVNRISTENVHADSLVVRIRNPIHFRPPTGGLLAYGYEATILAEICEAVLNARDKGTLLKQQSHIAERCDLLLRGFARVGIIALVDEVTGYQEVRSRQALEQILDRYIRGELGKWAKTFPDEFYQEMFRLRGWQYFPLEVKRPQYVGHLTNDIVYARLAPGVLKELQEREPKDNKGRRRHKFHQWLTDDVGHPRLKEHLIATLALMRAARKWDEFHRMLQRAYPKINTNLELPIDVPLEEESD
jgi:hypothetical protein